MQYWYMKYGSYRIFHSGISSLLTHKKDPDLQFNFKKKNKKNKNDQPTNQKKLRKYCFISAYN